MLLNGFKINVCIEAEKLDDDTLEAINEFVWDQMERHMDGLGQRLREFRSEIFIHWDGGHS